MFDYILAKPLTEESFSTIKNKLKKIYDFIIENNQYYYCYKDDKEDIKKLFRSRDDIFKTADQDECDVRIYTPEVVDEIKNLFISKIIDEKEAKERLNAVISTFCYAVNEFIKETMETYRYYRNSQDDCSFGDSDEDENEITSKVVETQLAIADLTDIIFGFGNEED